MRVADALHVFVAADLVFRLQAHLDESCVLRGVVRIDRREVGRGSDIRHDHLADLRRNGAAGSDASTLAHVLIGQFNRVPEGAFMLMTNWPASVRGKKASPIKG